MLPAVAVWEDFNDLKLTNDRKFEENTTQSPKKVKKTNKSAEQQLLYFGNQESGNMNMR